MFCDMIDQIIEYNIMSPLLGDGYKAGGIESIKTHPLVPKDIVVRGFIIRYRSVGRDSMTIEPITWTKDDD